MSLRWSPKQLELEISRIYPWGGFKNALEAAAAKRGVRVDVVMTRSSSWVSAFDALVRAGVAVRTYRESASLYIHAKVIVVDSDRVFLGSENFSVESLQFTTESLVSLQAALRS